jgi:hypothetical protein
LLFPNTKSTLSGALTEEIVMMQNRYVEIKDALFGFFLKPLLGQPLSSHDLEVLSGKTGVPVEDLREFLEQQKTT